MSADEASGLLHAKYESLGRLAIVVSRLLANHEAGAAGDERTRDVAMAAEKAPAFQFYPKDFLMDGNVAVMTLAERGAYITLLCLCWQERSLPSDAKRLARLCGTSTAAFARLWRALEPCFRVSGDDPKRLIHPRLEREREKQESFRRRQSDAGRASAARRQPEVQPESNHGSTASQPEVNSALSDLRSSSPISKEKQEPEKAVARTPRATRRREDPEKNLKLLTKIAHEAFDFEGVDSLADVTDTVKSLCGLRGIDYDGATVRKAVDSALAQRVKSA